MTFFEILAANARYDEEIYDYLAEKVKLKAFKKIEEVLE